MADMVSIRAFARLDGCDEKLVRRGIKEGRLTLGEDKLLDAALAGTGWRKRPPPRPAKGADKVTAKGADKVRTARKVSAVSAASKQRQEEPEGEPGETAEDTAARLASAGGPVPAYADSLARKEHFLALLRELEYRQKEAQLVEVETAREVLFEEFRAVRDAWMNWPARFGAEIAADLGVEADKVAAVLTAYVHRQLNLLAEPSGEISPSG